MVSKIFKLILSIMGPIMDLPEAPCRALHLKLPDLGWVSSLTSHSPQAYSFGCSTKLRLLLWNPLAFFPFPLRQDFKSLEVGLISSRFILNHRKPTSICLPLLKRKFIPRHNTIHFGFPTRVTHCHHFYYLEWESNARLLSPPNRSISETSCVLLKVSLTRL